MKTDHIIVAANRLPVKRTIDPKTNKATWIKSPGGLTSAVGPALAGKKDATWIGWPGTESKELTKPFEDNNIFLVPVELSAKEEALHYDGMSNGTLWPLYHDKIKPSEFHRSWFLGYQDVNEKFAEKILQHAKPNTILWVHDYQLQLVPEIVKKNRPDIKIGFFLHIPFPPAEIFAQLPWRDKVISGLLGSDLIGFHTPDSCNNFIKTVDYLHLSKENITNKTTSTSKGQQIHRIKSGDREIKAGTFPIGIDYKYYVNKAKEPNVIKRAAALREQMGSPKVVILGVDRLDYTKGIDIRLQAFGELLEDDLIEPSSVNMIQVAVPSRNNVKAYEVIKQSVEQKAGFINGKFGKVGSPAIHYINQNQPANELAALYLAADIMLVTPLRDGMNLVAMEYVASKVNSTGVLILSEFAGAAQFLADSLIVNPYDINGVKKSILKAINMPTEERKLRMYAMQKNIASNDVSEWAIDFINELNSDSVS